MPNFETQGACQQSEVSTHLQELRQNTRRMVGRTALILGLAVSGSPAAETSHASTGGYPDANAVDCSAAYGIYSWCKNGNWLSPRGYAYRNCTDWAAFRGTQLNSVRVPGNLGHAKDWDSNARGRFAVDRTPARGDIAQSNYGSFGHVGVVEKVIRNSEGKITTIQVSEYNKAGTGKYSINSYPVNSGRWDYFIDINGAPQPKHSPTPAPQAAPPKPEEPTFRKARTGDFNGDGLTDIALFRLDDRSWHIRDIGSFHYGEVGDIPVPADYDGDGKTDVAVYRPSSGGWHRRGHEGVSFGRPGDIPVPADYNGDDRMDMAVFRPSDGTWHIKDIGSFQYGTRGDIPVPGYYNQDKYADMAVYRPADNGWHIRGIGNISYGTAGDIPMQADYDNDGITDIGVYRPKDGTWRLRGINAFQYGASNDIPLTGYFNSDNNLDVAVYRPSGGSWHIRGIGNVLYGVEKDIPAVQTLNAELLKQYGLIKDY